MTTHGHDLLALISGRSSVTAPSSHSNGLIDLIRGGFSVKKAQDTLTDNKYTRSLDATADRKRQEAAERNRLADFRKSMLTGNSAYDALPDRVAARNAKERSYHIQQLADKSPSKRKKTREEIVREMDPSDNGDIGIGKVLGNFADYWGNKIGKGVGYFTAAPSGMSWSDWSKQYDQTARETNSMGPAHVKELAQGYTDNVAKALGTATNFWSGNGISDHDSSMSLGHDIVNNFRSQWNHVRSGAGSVGHIAQKYLDPGTWGNSAEAQVKKRRYDNLRDNDNLRTEERDRRIRARFNDTNLQDASQGIGKWNAIANNTVGEVGGGVAATGGIGMGSKLVGKGIQTAANAAGKAIANSIGSGSGVATTVGNTANTLVSGAGRVLATPFNVVGAMASPESAVQGVRSAATPVVQTGSAAVRGGYNTARAVLRPGADLLGYLRHPVVGTRNAMSYAAHHPFGAVGNTVAYGGRYLGNVGAEAAKGIYHTAKPIVRTAFSEPVWYGQTAMGTYGGLGSGDFGSAANSLAEGALGATPLGWGYAGLQMMGGGDSGEAYE